MGYTKLNTDLIERFGELERLCNQSYNTHHGVTNYIDEMKSLSFSGGKNVPDWNYTFKRLNEIRHKRNQLSHGEIAFNQQCATEADIQFIVNFRQSIMRQTDPLTLYHKQSKQKFPTPSVQKTYQQPIYQNKTLPNKSSGVLAILLFLFLIIGIIGFILLK